MGIIGYGGERRAIVVRADAELGIRRFVSGRACARRMRLLRVDTKRRSLWLRLIGDSVCEDFYAVRLTLLVADAVELAPVAEGDAKLGRNCCNSDCSEA